MSTMDHNAIEHNISYDHRFSLLFRFAFKSNHFMLSNAISKDF